MSMIELNYIKKSRAHNKKRLQMRKILAMSLLFCIIFSSFSKYEVARADANTQIGVKKDFIEQLVYLSPGTGGSTKYYMSTDKMKTWDSVDSSGVVDISNLFAAKKVDLYFKGNKDGAEYLLTLPEEDKTLSVIYKITAGVGMITFTPGLSVEYKKGEFGSWKTITSNTIYTSIYEVKGATLYFRTQAALEKRSGKIVAIKIPKSPTGPSVKIDGSKLSITGIKNGETQYRIGDSTGWLTYTSTISSAKSINLLSLLSPTATVNSIPIPAGIIEFRSQGNDKKLNSGVKIVEVALQAAAPETVAVTGTSISITDTDQKKAYEYTLVTKGSVLNLDTAKWTTMTSKKTVIVPKATYGDKILVRVKSTTDSKSKKIILASMYKEFLVSTISTK